MRILFMLPARSGSKGLPDKNIKLLCGKPLMVYGIESIINSKTYSKHDCYIMLNTDSEDYARIGEDFGANIPFIRPLELSTDDATLIDCMLHTKKHFDNINKGFDLFAVIQVTSPLIKSTDVDNAVAIFNNDNTVDSVISVTGSPIIPLWCNTLDESMSMNNFIPYEIRRTNRQDLPNYYYINGAIRITKWENVENRDFDWYASKSRAIIMDSQSSVDIDTIDDYEYAEFLLQRRI